MNKSIIVTVIKPNYTSIKKIKEKKRRKRNYNTATKPQKKRKLK